MDSTNNASRTEIGTLPRTPAETPLIVLRLTVPFADRAANLLEQMTDVAFLSEEEQRGLTAVRALLDSANSSSDRAAVLMRRALATTLVQVVEGAMDRLIACDEEYTLLEEWEKSLLALIQESLGTRQSAQAFITDFKTQVVAARRLQQKIVEEHTRGEEEIEELYRQFNAANEANNEGSTATRTRLNDIAAERLAQIRQMTQEISELQDKDIDAKKRLVDAVAVAKEQLKRLYKTHDEIGELAQHGLDVGAQIHV